MRELWPLTKTSERAQDFGDDTRPAVRAREPEERSLLVDAPYPIELLAPTVDIEAEHGPEHAPGRFGSAEALADDPTEGIIEAERDNERERARLRRRTQRARPRFLTCKVRPPMANAEGLARFLGEIVPALRRHNLDHSPSFLQQRCIVREQARAVAQTELGGSGRLASPTLAEQEDRARAQGDGRRMDTQPTSPLPDQSLGDAPQLGQGAWGGTNTRREAHPGPVLFACEPSESGPLGDKCAALPSHAIGDHAVLSHVVEPYNRSRGAVGLHFLSPHDTSPRLQRTPYIGAQNAITQAYPRHCAGEREMTTSARVAKRMLARSLDSSGLLQADFAARGAATVIAVNYHGTPARWASVLGQHFAFYRDRFECLGEDELLRFLRGELRLRRPGIVVSFDDGLRNNATVAAPLLEEFSLRGWFMVPGAFLDEPEASQPAYFKEQIRLYPTPSIRSTSRPSQ